MPSSVKGTVHAGTELIAAIFENVTVTSAACKVNITASLFFHMIRNNIIIGDFNSHNHPWGYRDDDENGLFLEEWISTHNLYLSDGDIDCARKPTKAARSEDNMSFCCGDCAPGWG